MKKKMVVFFIMMFVFNIFSSTLYAIEKETLKVAFYPQNGYQEVSDNGKCSGYICEYLQNIAQYTKWGYTFDVFSSFEESYEALRSGKADLMGCVLSASNYKEELSLSDDSCGDLVTSLFVMQESDIAYNDFLRFNGKTVAFVKTKRDYEDISTYAKQNGFTLNYLECETYDEVKAMVKDKKADMGICTGYKSFEQTRIVASFNVEPFYFATTKGKVNILKSLNNALSEIKTKNPLYDKELSLKYGKTTSSRIVLTNDEDLFINSEDNHIKIIFNDFWSPIQTIDHEKKEYSGIVADIFNNISKSTGLKFEYTHSATYADTLSMIKNNEADAIASFNYDLDFASANDLFLTEKYLSIPLTVVKTMKQDVYSEKISYPWYFTDFQNTAIYNEENYIPYNDPVQCVDSVLNGYSKETVINSYTAAFLLADAKYDSLISTPFPLNTFDVCLALCNDSDPVMVSIINKGIANISEMTLNDIIVKNTIDAVIAEKAPQNITLKQIINQMPVDVIFVFSILCFVLAVVLAILLTSRVRFSRKIRKMLYDDDVTHVLSLKGFDMSARKILNANQDDYFAIIEYEISLFEEFRSLYGVRRSENLLKAVVKITDSDVIQNKLTARIEDGRFLCLLPGINLADIIAKVDSMNALLKNAIAGTTLFITDGIYEISDKSIPLEQMREYAYVANQKIKGNFKSSISVYDENLHKQQLEEAEMVGAMELSLSNHEFIVYYQPKYDINTEEIIGAEALVRWKQNDNTFIRPIRFIKLFENNGLITKLDMYVFEDVCRKLAEDKRLGMKMVPVSVNFSRAHLFDKDFVKKLFELAVKYDISPELLEIELTESSFIDNIQILTPVISSLHEYKFLVSIDDFGSGYSSLNMLKDAAFDVIKLDREFLSHLDDNVKSGTIIKAVLSLARELDITTLAEGVETKAQLEFLRQNKCDMLQGFYFSKPLPESEYNEKLLNQFTCDQCENLF